MPHFEVDLDALRELRAALTRVRVSLEDVKDDVNAHDAALGSARIEDALDDFVSGWKDGRKKIINGIDGLANRLDAAIDAYTDAEDKITTSINESTSPDEGLRVQRAG